MTRRPEDVIIQEPPIQELSRQYSCLRRSCFSCLSVVLVILAVSLLILKFTLIPAARELKKAPPSVSESIPLYDQENLVKITVLPGADRSRAVEAAAWIPKAIVAPFFIALDKDQSFLKKQYPSSTTDIAKASWKEKFHLFLEAPIGDHRDEITLEWKDIGADTKFITEYYIEELNKRGYVIMAPGQTERVIQYTFSRTDLDGSLFIENDPATPSTDTMIIKIQTSTSTP